MTIGCSLQMLFVDRKSKMAISQEDVVYYIKWVLPQVQNVFNIHDLGNQYQWKYLKHFMFLFPWEIQKMTTNRRPACSYHRNLWKFLKSHKLRKNDSSKIVHQ